jgi:hypothetical protein
MSGFDGSGNYIRPYSWANDATNGVPITPSKFDTDGNTVATAFGNCLTRDGQGVPTGNLTWTNFTLALKTLSTTAGQSTLYEPLLSINAAKNAATYDQGTFTGTLTGCTTSPTATFDWVRVGPIATVYGPRTSLNATSNTTAMTVTGLPAALTPVRTSSFNLCSVDDNGVQVYGCVSISGTTLTFANGLATPNASFTGSGTKGVPLQGLQVTFSLV